MSRPAPIAPASPNEEVAKKFAAYEFKDPFPAIPPSLLNSSDIEDYINTTGMIWPFEPIKLKPATYALSIGGPYIYWDAKGTIHEGVLEKGKTLILEKDSILFISIEQYIQLPQYIAARFNLKIDNVYRGLLLGTGPQVDPGFAGYLSIPLHNFTSNDYHFKGGERIIWMEFTKISPNVAWTKECDTPERVGKFKPFDSKNRNKGLKEYITDADSRPIQSSIPLSVIRSEQAAKRAQKNARSLAIINAAIIMAVGAFVWSVYSQTSTFYTNVKKDWKDYESTLIFSDTLRVRAM